MRIHLFQENGDQLPYTLQSIFYIAGMFKLIQKDKKLITHQRMKSDHSFSTKIEIPGVIKRDSDSRISVG